MCFFVCVLVLYFHCYCAVFLKLHPICSSYAPSLLFYGDFPFVFYDDGEVITSPEFIFFAPFKFWVTVQQAIVRSIVNFLLSNVLK